MRKPLAFGVVLLFSLGCESKPNQVHFIIPDGFRGSFAVKSDDQDGIMLGQENGHFVLRIPESGVLGIRGYYPFRSYLDTASFVNGDEIWVSKQFGDKPRREQIALWGWTTEALYENGKPINRDWWFVGTEEEWNGADGYARYRLGGIQR